MENTGYQISKSHRLLVYDGSMWDSARTSSVPMSQVQSLCKIARAVFGDSDGYSVACKLQTGGEPSAAYVYWNSKEPSISVQYKSENALRGIQDFEPLLVISDMDGTIIPKFHYDEDSRRFSDRKHSYTLLRVHVHAILSNQGGLALKLAGCEWFQKPVPPPELLYPRIRRAQLSSLSKFGLFAVYHKQQGQTPTGQALASQKRYTPVSLENLLTLFGNSQLEKSPFTNYHSDKDLIEALLQYQYLFVYEERFRKPQPQGLFLLMDALRHWGIEASHVVYIGDEQDDMDLVENARKAKDQQFYFVDIKAELSR